MSANDITPSEKSISEQIDELLPQLSHNQMRYIVAMLDLGKGASKKDAAEMVGLRPDTVYRWNRIVDEVIELFQAQALLAAQGIRRRNLIKAIMVKVNGLDSENEAIRQKVATELIEWELGTATQRTDITSGGEQIQFVEIPTGGHDED